MNGILFIGTSFLIIGAWGVVLYVNFLRRRLRRMSVHRSWHDDVLRCRHTGRARKIDYIGYPVRIQCLECGLWTTPDNAIKSAVDMKPWSNRHPYGLVGMLLDVSNPFRLYNSYDDDEDMPKFGAKP